MVSGDLNSSPHACVANALTSELSLQAPFSVLSKLKQVWSGTFTVTVAQVCCDRPSVSGALTSDFRPEDPGRRRPCPVPCGLHLPHVIYSQHTASLVWPHMVADTGA